MAVLEEELKNRIGEAYFKHFDYKKIIGKIDFCVTKKVASRSKQQDLFMKNDSDTDLSESYLWAEAKAGTSHDIYGSIVQLVLTIGKAKTYERYVTPPFLGAFDAEKIAFIPWKSIDSVFSQNDFNWKVTPSDHNSKEFKQLYAIVKKVLKKDSLLFYYKKDDKEIREFIAKNLIPNSTGVNQIVITKNNFTSIYYKWVKQVRDTIAVPGGWQELKKKTGILDADFYLADLLSSDSVSLKEALFVYLKKDHYEFDRKIEEGFESVKNVRFNDNQEAYMQFWAHYKRPPKKEYWDYIVKRRDLLVPQDIRERKGSFFTPQVWVEKSQEYLVKALGENWQDDYYVWDCCAGTGNLLAGLTNKYKIFASTLDKADVSVIQDRIKNGANLLDSHVFQFDFLNDDLNGEKVPEKLREVLQDPKKRKKLVIYINPPYAEVSSKIVSTDGSKGKKGVNQTNVQQDYLDKLGTASRELFAQFLIRIYSEIQGAVIANFSTLKVLNGAAFRKFRQYYTPQLKQLFLTPANSFDNVKGKFPIGFFVWDTKTKEGFNGITATVFDYDGKSLKEKHIYPVEDAKYINTCISKFKPPRGSILLQIGYMDGINGNDVQHNTIVYIVNSKGQLPNPRGVWINQENLIPVSIYLTVRRIIAATWLNISDQYLCPDEKWEKDEEFKTDCLTFALFNESSRISATIGKNYWIPFKEQEVNAQDAFDSHFMTDFMSGKLGNKTENPFVPKAKLEFSSEAQAVFEAGKALWIYYHKQPNTNVNASLYDIKEYFQGRDEKGRMNTKSTDQEYNELIGTLRSKMEDLASKIRPKVFEYGFLKE